MKITIAVDVLSSYQMKEMIKSVRGSSGVEALTKAIHFVLTGEQGDFYEFQWLENQFSHVNAMKNFRLTSRDTTYINELNRHRNSVEHYFN